MSNPIDDVAALLGGESGKKAPKKETLRLSKDAEEVGSYESPGAEPGSRRENGRDHGRGRAEGDGDDRRAEPAGESHRGEAAEGREGGGEEARPGPKGRWKDLDDDATLRDLSKAMDIPATRLYKLQVPLGDGTGRTLSVEDLKAGYLASDAGELDNQRHEFASQKAQFEQRAIDAENAVLRSRRELQTVLNMVGDKLPVEVMKGLQNEAQASYQREAGLLLESMPQFQDHTVYRAWQDDAHKTLADFGFSRAEVENLSDHRVYRVVDAFMRLSKRVKALEDVTADPKVPPKTVRSQKRAPSSKAKDAVAKAKQSGRRDDQITAVESLIS